MSHKLGAVKRYTEREWDSALLKVLLDVNTYLLYLVICMGISIKRKGKFVLMVIILIPEFMGTSSFHRDAFVYNGTLGCFFSPRTPGCLSITSSQRQPDAEGPLTSRPLPPQPHNCCFLPSTQKWASHQLLKGCMFWPQHLFFLSKRNVFFWTIHSTYRLFSTPNFCGFSRLWVPQYFKPVPMSVAFPHAMW